MKTIYFWILIGLMVVGSFFFGVRWGVNEYFYANSANEALLNVVKLERLQDGRIDEVIWLLESDLDENIVRHASYLDSKNAWIWSDIANNSDGYMRTVVEYRNNHLFSGLSISRSQFEEDEEGDKQYEASITIFKEIELLKAEVLAKYSEELGSEK